MKGYLERVTYHSGHAQAAVAAMPQYVNPGKWLNISWLLEGVDVKSIALSIALSSYLLLSVGVVAGEIEIMDRSCVHCRLEMAGIKSSDAPKSVRKLMKYHGVNVMKTHNDENFVLYKGRWEKVSPERPT